MISLCNDWEFTPEWTDGFARGDGGADYTAELARLDQAIATQTAMLNEQVSHEVSALDELTARLTQIAA